MNPRPVLVVDFGAQYAQLIARRVREAHLYSEVVPHTWTAEQILAKQPLAIILSGGPASVYVDDAPSFDAALLQADVPAFGICYGFQVMADALGGRVDKTGLRGVRPHRRCRPGRVCCLPGNPPTSRSGCRTAMRWSRRPLVVRSLPVPTATPVAAFVDSERRLAGVQFHPEVVHTDHGQAILQRFLYDIAGLTPNWSTEGVIDAQVETIAAQVGEGRAICGLSGGVDSAVAAALVQRAIGDRLTCVFVDHGLLRQGEVEQVERDFVAATGAHLVVVDARKRFLDALAGVTDPEQKRKIIGREFIRVFEAAAADVVAGGDVQFLVQGTLYPDVVESGGGTGTANIKSHHNVGGLPEDLEFELVEPLRDLFKDEVRAVGTALGLPEEMVWRHPFPGPGLAIRIVGEVTEENLEMLRQADAIARAELSAAGLDRSVWQFPVVLLAGVRSVGVQGDGRTYGHPVVLRPVSSEDAMTADWSRLPHEVIATISTRITNEVPAVNRVVLDVTSKPPGTIEWE
ncbi:MAG: glutamine-hydrolyzing GMP synthase [Candidatus Nanopelagicales bacterium]